MCRNIRTLHNFEPASTEEEIRASALQYVRKVSGYTSPSRANTEAFARRKRHYRQLLRARQGAGQARDEAAEADEFFALPSSV